VAALVGQERFLHREREHYVNHRREWTQIEATPVPFPGLVNRMKQRLEIYGQVHELKELKDEFRRLRQEREDPPAE
jgi:hypothetical protein